MGFTWWNCVDNGKKSKGKRIKSKTKRFSLLLPAIALSAGLLFNTCEPEVQWRTEYVDKDCDKDHVVDRTDEEKVIDATKDVLFDTAFVDAAITDVRDVEGNPDGTNEGRLNMEVRMKLYERMLENFANQLPKGTGVSTRFRIDQNWDGEITYHAPLPETGTPEVNLTANGVVRQAALPSGSFADNMVARTIEGGTIFACPDGCGTEINENVASVWDGRVGLLNGTRAHATITTTRLRFIDITVDDSHLNQQSQSMGRSVAPQNTPVERDVRVRHQQECRGR